MIVDSGFSQHSKKSVQPLMFSSVSHPGFQLRDRRRRDGDSGSLAFQVKL